MSKKKEETDQRKASEPAKMKEAYGEVFKPLSTDEYKRYLKSPYLLLAYYATTNRNIIRDSEKVLGRFSMECPAKSCHAISECIEDEDYVWNTAQIVVERGTGIARIYCPLCGGSWDVFGLIQHDLHCTREEAIEKVVNELSYLLADE